MMLGYDLLPSLGVPRKVKSEAFVKLKFTNTWIDQINLEK